MSVKVIMERTVKAGKEQDLGGLLRDLRAVALNQPGYISGQTLLDVEHPRTHIVVSEWHALDDWKRWAASAERQALTKRIQRLLEGPTKTRVCIDSLGAPPA